MYLSTFSAWLTAKEKGLLYGAKQEVIQAVADRLSTEYPGIELAGYSHGYVKDKGEVAKQIAAAKPDMVLSLSDILIRKSLFMNISIYFLRRLRSASAGASTCSAEK